MNQSIIDRLIASGAARPATLAMSQLPEPLKATGTSLTELLEAAQDAER